MSLSGYASRGCSIIRVGKSTIRFREIGFRFADRASRAEATIRLGHFWPDGLARQFFAMAERSGSTNWLRPGRRRFSADRLRVPGLVAATSRGHLAPDLGCARQARETRFEWFPLDCERTCSRTIISPGKRNSFRCVSNRRASWRADRCAEVGRRAVRRSGAGSSGGKRCPCPVVLGPGQSLCGAPSGKMPCGRPGVSLVSCCAVPMPAANLQ